MQSFLKNHPGIKSKNHFYQNIRVLLPRLHERVIESSHIQTRTEPYLEQNILLLFMVFFFSSPPKSL